MNRDDYAEPPAGESGDRTSCSGRSWQLPSTLSDTTIAAGTRTRSPPMATTDPAPLLLIGLLVLAIWVSVVLHRDRRRMARCAITDPVTGLPNRLGLANAVDGALARDHDEPQPCCA